MPLKCQILHILIAQYSVLCVHPVQHNFLTKNFALFPAESFLSLLHVGFSPFSAHAVIKITMVTAKVKPFRYLIIFSYL